MTKIKNIIFHKGIPCVEGTKHIGNSSVFIIGHYYNLSYNDQIKISKSNLNPGDKVLVECEKSHKEILGTGKTTLSGKVITTLDWEWSYKIKLNEQGHITIHLPEKEFEVPDRTDEELKQSATQDEQVSGFGKHLQKMMPMLGLPDVSEQLVNFLLYLNDKKLINNHDFDYEKEAKKYLTKSKTQKGKKKFESKNIFSEWKKAIDSI